MDCSHSESEVFKIHKSETIKHSSVFTIILSTWIQHLWSSEQIPPEVETALCSPPGTDRSPSPQRAPGNLLMCFLLSPSLKDQREEKKGYLAHRWDDLEGIKVIKGVHPRSSHFAELQTHEPELKTKRTQRIPFRYFKAPTFLLVLTPCMLLQVLHQLEQRSFWMFVSILLLPPIWFLRI